MFEKIIKKITQILVRFSKIVWHIVKIACCLCLIIATFYYGYNYFNKVFRNPDVNYGEEFHNMPKNSVDIIVLGSSHAQYSFNPVFAYQDTGLYSYVLGSACQPLKVSYEMLKEGLKTQSPELVILETFTATPLKSVCMTDTCFVTAEYQMRGEEKYNTIDFMPEEKAKEYKNDFINYHNNWRTMESYDELIYKENKSLDYSFGYCYNISFLPVENSWYSDVFDETADVELEKEDVEALNNIKNLCKEKGIQLLLYMMPMENLDVENQSYRYKIWEWANENNINYIDFVDLSEELDFRDQVHHDGFHAYINGASFITDYLCSYIKDNYVFKNHVDSKYLDESYVFFQNGYNLDVLSSEYNPYKYLPRLINAVGTTIIRYEPNHGVTDEKITDLIKNVCKDEEFDPNSNYFAIIKDGVNLISSRDDINYEIDNHHIEISKNDIIIDNEVANNDDYFSIVYFRDEYSWFLQKRINLEGIPWEVGHKFNSYESWACE